MKELWELRIINEIQRNKGCKILLSTLFGEFADKRNAFEKYLFHSMIQILKIATAAFWESLLSVQTEWLGWCIKNTEERSRSWTKGERTACPSGKLINCFVSPSPYINLPMFYKKGRWKLSKLCGLVDKLLDKLWEIYLVLCKHHIY